MTWSKESFDRLLPMFKGDYVDPREDHLPPPAEGIPVTPLETVARELSTATQLTMSLYAPALLALPSAIGDGAFWTRMPTAGGGRWIAPITIQSILLAQSGVGKSTALRRVMRIADPALHHGLMSRMTWAQTQIAAAETAGVAAELQEGMRAMFNAGKCLQTRVESATPEALRNRLVGYGGHQLVATAESDIFEEISKYASNGASGTVTFFLAGWDGDPVNVARVKEGSIHVERASLPMVLYMQKQTFPRVTGENAFMEKGLLHRSLIMAGARTGGTDWKTADLGAGKGIVETLASPLAVAQDQMVDQLKIVAERGAGYRASLAARAFWMAGHGVGMPHQPPLDPPVMLELEPGAVADYREMQMVREQLTTQLAAIGDSGEDGQFVVDVGLPLATRYADHVMRVASALTLSVDGAALEIPAWALRDAATRWVPWLMAGWFHAMVERESGVLDDVAVASMMTNPTGEDRSPAEVIIRAMGRMELTRIGIPGGSFRELPDGKPGSWEKSSEVIHRVRKSLGKTKMAAKSMASRSLRVWIEDLAQRGLVEIEEIPPGPSGGRPGSRSRLTVAGIQYLRSIK